MNNVQLTFYPLPYITYICSSSSCTYIRIWGRSNAQNVHIIMTMQILFTLRLVLSNDFIIFLIQHPFHIHTQI